MSHLVICATKGCSSQRKGIASAAAPESPRLVRLIAPPPVLTDTTRFLSSPLLPFSSFRHRSVAGRRDQATPIRWERQTDRERVGRPDPISPFVTYPWKEEREGGAREIPSLPLSLIWLTPSLRSLFMDSSYARLEYFIRAGCVFPTNLFFFHHHVFYKLLNGIFFHKIYIYIYI